MPSFAAQRRPPSHGGYRIRLNLPASDCDDAWEMYQTALYCGGVPLLDCCFAFPTEDRREAALEMLRFRFGPGYCETVDASPRNSGTRLLFLASDSRSTQRCCRFFAERDFLVFQAASWDKMADIFRTRHPDVVIVKEAMLRRERGSVQERAQTYAQLTTTPVVLISKRGRRGSDMSGSALSVTARFSEPVPLDRLLDTVRSIVLARQSGP